MAQTRFTSSQPLCRLMLRHDLALAAAEDCSECLANQLAATRRIVDLVEGL